MRKRLTGQGPARQDGLTSRYFLICSPIQCVRPRAKHRPSSSILFSLRGMYRERAQLCLLFRMRQQISPTSPSSPFKHSTHFSLHSLHHCHGIVARARIGDPKQGSERIHSCKLPLSLFVLSRVSVSILIRLLSFTHFGCVGGI